jgi:geranylgeranyl pyrophosphate synthase
MSSEYKTDFLADMDPDLAAHYTHWYPFCREAVLSTARGLVTSKAAQFETLLGDAAISETCLRRYWLEPFESYLHRSGKMLRPYLVCLCLEAFGVDPRSRPKQVAMAEMIHSSSLMLDDIADDSLLRRGAPCAHQVHGVVVAGAAASAWFNIVVELAWNEAGDDFETARKLMEAITWEHFVTGLGTTIDVTWSWQANINGTVQQYLQQVVHRSTSYTYRLPLKIGAIAAGAAEREALVLAQFGEKLGLAFQLIDDILNVAPRDNRWGKEVAEDISQGKITLQVLLALEVANGQQRSELLGILGSQTHDAALLQRAVGILRDTGALERAERQAATWVAEAKRSLETLDSRILARRLTAFADYVILRSR